MSKPSCPCPTCVLLRFQTESINAAGYNPLDLARALVAILDFYVRDENAQEFAFDVLPLAIAEHLAAIRARAN